MSQNLQDRIIEIIAEQAVLEPEDLSPQDRLEELGLDSLGLVEAIFAIEESFEVQVPFNANDPEQSDFDITTVQSVIDGVEKLIAQKEAS